MSKEAAATLNELMIKKGIKPEYNLIRKNDGKHLNEFVFRVECPIVVGGPLRYADGIGLSKKEAKRQAAQAFLQKFVSEYNSGCSSQAPVYRTPKSKVHCAVNIDSNKILNVLQMICDKHNLGPPQFGELGAVGPSHSKIFTLQCRVSDLSTKGQGNTKREAKLIAATEMIQILMQEAEVYEIFESPRSMPSENSDEIVCLTINLEGCQLPLPTGIFARRRPSDASLISCSDSETPSTRLSASLDIPRTATAAMHCQIRVAHGAESNDFSNISNSNKNLIDSLNNSQKPLVGIIRRSKSLSNLSEGVKNGETKTSITVTRVVGKIESTIEKVEKILYSEILDNLASGRLRVEKTVIILHHEFTVFIDAESERPKILEGESQCTDSSIRIACLSKVLVDLKNYVKKHKKCGK